MPNEALISQIENILSQVVDIGGQQEITTIVTNLEVVDASPTGLTGFITIVDERDGDTILAKKVPGVGYAAADLVNVLFVNGTEPVAFQQASQSSGDPVLVSKLVSPDETIDPVISADNSGDVTISGTGDLIVPDQIIHSGDIDNNITFTDDVQTYNVGGVTLLILTEAVQDLINIGSGSGDVDIDLNGDVFIRGSDGFVGIGTSVPTRILDIRDPVGGVAALGRSDTSIVNGNTLGVFHFQGDDPDDTTFRTGGFIAGIAAGTWSADNYPGQLRFATNPGQIAAVDRMRIHSDGNIRVGDTATAPLARFHVDQDSTTAAIPTLALDQADLSEEMIRFITTIGVGNPVEAVGAKTLTVTHFIKIELPGGLIRYFEAGTIA